MAGLTQFAQHLRVRGPAQLVAIDTSDAIRTVMRRAKGTKTRDLGPRHGRLRQHKYTDQHPSQG